ncbi:MAG TPA: class II aldolase/adducin family protein, partial [Actinomycetales bacterium]|nr:class II aldolase/adducin family protein [Actinomycetales bacterium]
EKTITAELISAGKVLSAAGLSPGTTGNISARVAGGFLVSPSGSSLGDLQELAFVSNTGEHVGGPTPTKEVPMHRAIYDNTATYNAVVHLHSTYATIYSSLADIDPDDAIPAITPYLTMKAGRVGVIPYFRPGSPEIGAALAEGIKQGRSAFLMSNHGLVVAGANMDAAVALAFELEESAKIALLGRDLNLRILTPAQRQELMPK